jgi:hypothetical protein
MPTVEPADPDLEGEELATWDDEHAMAAEISEAEAFEPRSIADAMKRSDWPLWDKTIQEELGVLKEAGTWDLVDIHTFRSQYHRLKVGLEGEEGRRGERGPLQSTPRCPGAGC